MQDRTSFLRRLSSVCAAFALVLPTLMPSFALAATQPASVIGDPYTIVDCLLPGATRKLGSKMIIAGRRMPARVPARDCEIRGGEYVLDNRSSYSSSLAVWMPQAESGDARAQTYVGDILVKGAGSAPDYAGAARWYQKAADQGFGPAMFSLGTLYENGSGVPQNRETAVTWYRKAAGLEAPQFNSVTFAPASDAVMSSIKSELDTERGESNRLRQQVQQLQAEITKRQGQQADITSVNAERATLDAERAALAKERSALAATVQINTSKQTSELEKIKQSAEHARLEAEAKLEALSVQEAALRKREAAIASKEAATATSKDTDRAQLDAERQKLALEREAVKAAAQAAEIRASKEVLDARAAQEKVRLDAEAKLAALTARENAVETREAAIADRERSLDSKRAELAKLQSELDKQRDALVAQPDLAALTKSQRSLAPSSPPQIVMLDPQVLDTRGDSIMVTSADAISQVITGQVRTAGQKLVSLTINGVRANPTSAGIFGAELPVTATPTSVQIVAVDAIGMRSQLRFDLRRAAPVAPPSVVDRAREIVSRAHLGKFYAVLIGNTHYRNGWNELKTPSRDVEEMGAVLRTQYGFEVDIVQDATREGIGAALYKLREKVGENDSVIIYYAGHGAFLPSATGDRGYWIPIDGDKNDPTNWIASDTIHEWVGMLSARKVLVISDSCFSGLLMRSGSAFVQVGKSDDAQLELLRSEAEGRSRTYLTSGRDAPVFDQGGAGGQHSMFAQAMIDTLKSNKSVTTGRSLAAQIEQTVLYLSKLATKGTDSQQPDYQPMRLAGHVAGDFIFVPRGQ